MGGPPTIYPVLQVSGSEPHADPQGPERVARALRELEEQMATERAARRWEQPSAQNSLLSTTWMLGGLSKST